MFKKVINYLVIFTLFANYNFAGVQQENDKNLEEQVVEKIFDDLCKQFKLSQEEEKLIKQNSEPDYENIDQDKRDIAFLYRNIKESKESALESKESEELEEEQEKKEPAEEEKDDILKREFVLIINKSLFPVFVAIYNTKKHALERKVATVDGDSRGIVLFDSLVSSLKDVIMNDGDTVILGFSYGKEQHSFKTSFF